MGVSFCNVLFGHVPIHQTTFHGVYLEILKLLLFPALRPSGSTSPPRRCKLIPHTSFKLILQYLITETNALHFPRDMYVETLPSLPSIILQNAQGTGKQDLILDGKTALRVRPAPSISNDSSALFAQWFLSSPYPGFINCP